jgi:adenylate cyclase
MTSRTIEEIKIDLDHAFSINDSEALLRYASEFDAIGTPEAKALASNARGWVHSLRGDYNAAINHFHNALSIHEELSSRSGEASVTGNIGIVHSKIGDYPGALSYYHRALSIHEELGNRNGVATVTGNIGNVHKDTGNYAEALSHFSRALALHEELGDRSGVARVRGNIGIVYGMTGNNPEALDHFHQALALYDEISDRAGIARVLGNIGVVHDITGDYPEALGHFYRALALHEEHGDQSGMARVTGNIGKVFAQIGDYREALSHYLRALSLYEDLGEPRGVARVKGNIGTLHKRSGDDLEALSHLQHALSLYDKLGDHSGVALVKGNLVGTYLDMGSDTEAQALLDTMDNIQIDDPAVRVLYEQHRARLQERRGSLDGAAASMQHALAEAAEHGLRAQEAESHKGLRDLALKRNDLAGYVEHNNEYTRITEEINGKDTATKLAMQAKQREIEAKDRETQKHLAVLHSTLPKQIADRVARGEVVNDHYDSATVIFLDIVGFTTISDHIPSGHVVHLLEQIFTTLDAACDRHNVVKIKTIGDSYMAVSFERVANAASCALDMLASLDALEITMPPALGETSWTNDIGEIKVRIGMHCGPVTAGVIGTQRLQYDVWGDTVNVASRLEGTSEPGRIHVSEAFATVLRSVSDPAPYTLTPRGMVEIKGKGAMTTYWLEDTST